MGWAGRGLFGEGASGTMERMSYQPPLPSAQPLPEPPAKRPWLPKRHVIGLALVLVFIVGSIGASWVGLSKTDWGTFGTAKEDPRGYTGSMADDMTTAMLRGDREEFVKWGEGAVEDQLGQIWDESKKLGWTIGYVSQVRSEEDERAEQLRRLEKDLSLHYASGLAISLDLGVSQKRVSDGLDPECGELSYGCGLLTHAFEYDLEVFDHDTKNELDRITKLTPRKPMPWDTEEGVHAVRHDNAVVFGYASEAARIDEVAGEVQRGAAAVLDTPLASAPYSVIEGFPAFVTDDPKRYRDATFGPGGEPSSSRDWIESGLTLSSQLASAPASGYEPTGSQKILSGMGEQGMALVALNGPEIEDFFTVAAHEFAHAYDLSTFTHMFASDGDEAAHGFGREGFATFVEGIAVEAAGGQARSMSPEVRALIASTPEQELGGLVNAAAFRNGETAGTAYAVAGNYFAFLADGGADIVEVVKSAEYLQYDPDVWVLMHYPQMTSGGTMDARYAAWRAWNAS